MCAKVECAAPQVGKSKYCAPHRDAAREAWVKMIQEKSGSKESKAAEWAKVHAEADKAGREAAEAVYVEPMHVVERQNPFDDSSPVVRRYAPVASGVCGFAWVLVTPGNSSFALWLKKSKGARSAYGGGVAYRIHDYGQSLTRKEAYASGYAAKVRELHPELKVYAQSRMD